MGKGQLDAKVRVALCSLISQFFYLDKHFSPDLDFSAIEALEKFALYNLR
jgi:hypothetical protein